jgi:hypothetical protein
MCRIPRASSAFKGCNVAPSCMSSPTEASLHLMGSSHTMLTVMTPAIRADCRKAGCRLAQGELRHGCHGTVSSTSEHTG